MMRMLQGDVGCGKTIIAFLSAIFAIKAGYQVAIMCPTETLAQQHFQNIRDYFGDLLDKIELFVGSQKRKIKNELIQKISNENAFLIIGTHTLFQEGVNFQRLGLAIIDEQHKFGVEQRLRLTAKGNGTHCLIMSATPIPRSLSLAQYGDLDFSTIKTMPEGRKATKSRLVEKENFLKYIEFLRQRLTNGEQGYFVFPAIEESDKMALENVTQALKEYKKIFPEFQIFELHGKMKPDEKEKIINEFKQNRIQILISTSVIEVGINIPNATFMSVYDPDRFGLSSLHQLRGRVGRGDKQGYFFMVTNKELSPSARERLTVLERSTSGFEIAEADLAYRGGGDLFGVDQSGVGQRKRIADYMKHSHVLEQVYKDVRNLLDSSPQKIDPILAKLALDQRILDTI
jgi:ATP-dependent DNA helicase RecG